MSNFLTEELKKFLGKTNLSNYEISTYLVLLLSSESLNAREISQRSSVPIGRIYEVLRNLKNMEMIEIQKFHPKMFNVIPFHKAFQNLISYKINENKKNISSLYEEARSLELKIINSNIFNKKKKKTLWSTEFDIASIFSLYTKYTRELKEEFLSTYFLNEKVLNLIPAGKNFFTEMLNAINRGIEVKSIWGRESNNKLSTHEHFNKQINQFQELKKEIKELYDLSTDNEGFEIKYVPKMIPTYFIIFDKKRVIIRLQNPLRTSEIFAEMNVLDATLAMELREIFYDLWFSEAID